MQISQKNATKNKKFFLNIVYHCISVSIKQKVLTGYFQKLSKGNIKNLPKDYWGDLGLCSYFGNLYYFFPIWGISSH